MSGAIPGGPTPGNRCAHAGAWLTDVNMTDSKNSRQRLDFLLAECVRLDASDVHLAPNLPPYLRIHGILEPRETLGVVDVGQMEGLAEELMKPFDRGPLQKT